MSLRLTLLALNDVAFSFAELTLFVSFSVGVDDVAG
jgi:hypothetical protein